MFNAKILVARNQDIKKLLNEYNKCNLNPSKCAVQICQKPKCPLLCDPFDQPDRRTDRATNPLPPSPYLRARSPRLKSTRFHVDGGGREGHCHCSAGARDTRMPGADGRTAYRQLRQDNLGVETLAANLFDLKASRVSESGFTYILRLTSKESKRMRYTSLPSPNLNKILCRRPEH